VRELQITSDDHWRRYRIQWADFINANTSKKSNKVKPQDLIKLPEDAKQNKATVTPDIESVKKKLGSKIKKRKDGK
jgi:hypothetical protein